VGGGAGTLYARPKLGGEGGLRSLTGAQLPADLLVKYREKYPIF
jgi:hypothetical protein